MPYELTSEELSLIEGFNGVKIIPEGVRKYADDVARSRRSQVLFERHEKVRVMYRSLIGHGFNKWEIASMMKVNASQVRAMVNKLGLIWELKGLGEEFSL